MSPRKDAGPSPAAAPATVPSPKSSPFMPMGQMRRDECADLLKLISGVSRPLEEVVGDFLARVPPERRLRFGSAVKFILEDKMMFRPAERLVAFAILHQGYSSQLTNPFVPLLINVACDETSERPERIFLQLLLTSANADNNKEILKQSAEDYLKEPSYASQVLLPRDELERQHSCNAVQPQTYTSYTAAKVRSAIPDPDVSQSCGDSSGISPAKPNRNNVVTDLLQQTLLRGLSPPWIRPSPPRLEILEGELQWLNLDNNHELLWDSSMCADTSRGASIRDLVGRACKGPLAPAQQEKCIGPPVKDGHFGKTYSRRKWRGGKRAGVP